MKKNILIISISIITGLILGWILFYPSAKESTHHDEVTAKATVWTCSMHPQIRMDKPGKCPICGMDLIPLNQNSQSIDDDAIQLTQEAIALANIQTSMVTRQNQNKELRLYGKVQTDEQLLQNQVAHISGRIEKLMVNFTGDEIKKGQTIAIVYSPELITAQQELLEASNAKQLQPEIYEAAKAKLSQWQLTDDQISAVETSGKVKNEFEIRSNTSGIVTARRINVGDYINQGTILYDIANLSTVWVVFDAYESDLPFIKKGDKVSFTLQALPGEEFTGKIQFIDPVIDPATRVAKVRIDIPNAAGKLKPEMFATGIIHADIGNHSNALTIPRSAVLWTGKRSIVYVKQTGFSQPVFKLREVDLGPLLGDNYIVSGGLNEGEEIVTQGTFSVDAAAQLAGKPSMMNSTTETGVADQKTHENHATFGVNGNCDMCKERIETAALSVDGIKTATWNSDTKKMVVNYDGSMTDLDAIQKAISAIGHDTEKFKADDEVYQNLAECCRYRK